MLSHPVMIGTTRDELAELVALLAPAQEAKTEQRNYNRRGGKRRRAKGAGGMTVITPTARIVATLVHLRGICTMPVLQDLLGVTRSGPQKPMRETRALLAEHNHTVRAIDLRLTTTQAVRDFVASAGSLQEIDPQEALRHPAITGMTHAELDAITTRLATRYQARLQEMRHNRRGAELKKDPGAVIYRKITDEGRVLAAILAMRQVTTRPVIADLFKSEPSNHRQRTRGTAPTPQRGRVQPNPRSQGATVSQRGRSSPLCRSQGGIEYLCGIVRLFAHDFPVACTGSRIC